MNLLLRNESQSVVVINILLVTCSDARYFDDNDYYRYRSSALAPIWSRGGYEWYDRSDRQVGERFLSTPLIHRSTKFIYM